jgi:hypothetical protein
MPDLIRHPATYHFAKGMDSGSVIPDVIRERNGKNTKMRGFENCDTVCLSGMTKGNPNN